MKNKNERMFDKIAKELTPDQKESISSKLDLAELLNECLERNQISQKQVMDEADLTQEEFDSLLTGLHHLSNDKVQKVKALLNGIS